MDTIILAKATVIVEISKKKWNEMSEEDREWMLIKCTPGFEHQLDLPNALVANSQWEMVQRDLDPIE